MIDGWQADVLTLALACGIDAIASKGLTTTDWQKRLRRIRRPIRGTASIDPRRAPVTIVDEVVDRKAA
ncbi:MAG: hypothetical protein AB1745_15825 [Pseudomonadota bacterium]